MASEYDDYRLCLAGKALVAISRAQKCGQNPARDQGWPGDHFRQRLLPLEKTEEIADLLQQTSGLRYDPRTQNLGTLRTLHCKGNDVTIGTGIRSSDCHTFMRVRHQARFLDGAHEAGGARTGSTGT
jgi:hypothetical protein